MMDTFGLWLTCNQFLGEIYLCFLTFTINHTIHYTEPIQGDDRDSIVAFTDININMYVSSSKQVQW